LKKKARIVRRINSMYGSGSRGEAAANPDRLMAKVSKQSTEKKCKTGQKSNALLNRQRHKKGYSGDEEHRTRERLGDREVRKREKNDKAA